MYERGFESNHITNKEKIGLFEVTNFYRKIHKIERMNEDLTMILCENINTPVIPFPLIISRLMSLNDKEAYELAGSIDHFVDSQNKTIKALEPKNAITSRNEISLFDIQQLKINNSSNFLLYDIDPQTVNKDSTILSNFQASFSNEQELKNYESFLKRNENFLKIHQEKGIYLVRYKATADSNSYQTIQHFFNKMYGRLICPDDTFYLRSLFREGIPNPFKCSKNYFMCINKYIQNLQSEFNHDEPFIESEGQSNDNEEENVKDFLFETMDGIQMPVKIKLTVDIFKGSKFIEVIKKTEYDVSEENKRFLLSEERKKGFVMNYKIKRQEEGTGFEEKKFITRFYPGVIPKNEISMNQSKICHYREINIIDKN